ncbi:MAG TPA: hypothetical protein VD973_04160 [Symbiobacteriaceae bacterium]|nr:hypothetical protein [Symbiobacteriaceae bacterium]
MKRSVLVGAGIGLALAMPLFEVCLLVILAVDGEVFDAAYTIKYFTNSANVIGLLAVLHVALAMVGGLMGALAYQARNRKRLRLVRGGER